MQDTKPGASRLADAAEQTLERVTRAAAQAASRLSERSEALRALQGRTLRTARGYVRAHPIAAVATALAVGLLIARLTSRR